MGHDPSPKFPAYAQEAERLAILQQFQLDGLQDDPELDSIARFAAELCETPIGLVSLVEEERQFFLAKQGLDARETPREDSFCTYAMLQEDVMIVPDALKDQRFADGKLVMGDPQIRFYAGQPLLSQEGLPLGTLCVIDQKPREGLTDLQKQGLKVLGAAVTRRLRNRRENLRARADLEFSEAKLQIMADSIPDIAWSTDTEGNIDYFNQRWFEFTGLSGSESITDKVYSVFHPDDRAEWSDKWAASRANGENFSAEFRMLRADGQYRWMLGRALPVRRDDGTIDRWFGTTTDIDDTHRQSEGSDLLARELSHRIKNIFAVVSSLITLRSRGKPEVTEFAQDLTQTIRSLGRAHDYVRPMEGRKGDSLLGLLDDLLAPYHQGASADIAVDGEDYPIGARAATPLALVFHELATNSAKYGALSDENGAVKVSIAPASDDPANDMLVIHWSETAHGEPPAEGAEGFGSRLVKLSVEGQLGGSITREFAADGLHVTLTVSAEAIAS